MTPKRRVYICGICGESTEHDPGKRFIPHGWHNRMLNGSLIALCETCGGSTEWMHGPSSALKEQYFEMYGEELRDEE